MHDARRIDIHCHVAAEMCFPRSFREGIVDNMAVALEAKGLPLARETVERFHDGTLQDPLCDELVEEMDEAGIDAAVLLAPDFTYALRDSTHTIEELLEHHRAVQERHPGRFRVMAGVDPRWGSDGIALFERAICEYGFDGMKLYPPCGYTLSDRALWPYYELCSAHGLPVLTHIGATSPALAFGIADPMSVEEAARAFPGVDFILAHGSVHHPEACAMLCSHRPNVYLDVSGYQTADIAGLNRLFRRGINHKVLFGTDWPIFRLQGRQVDFVERLEAQGAFPDAMSQLDRELFFAGNAARLLMKKKAPYGGKVTTRGMQL